MTDFGSLFNIFMAIFYLVISITFMFCKRGSFGIKRKICFKSEEIWHKVHFTVALVIIPFVIISIIISFIDNFWLKVIIGAMLIFLFIIAINVTTYLVTRKDELEEKLKEEQELNEQIRNELGIK